MKIKKVYEDNIIPKDNILSDFFEKREEYETLKDKILELINEYVEYNKEYFDSKYFINYGRWNVSFNRIEDIETNHKSSVIILTTEHNHIVNLIHDDSKKLIEFLENPDLYRSQKKYNL